MRLGLIASVLLLAAASCGEGEGRFGEATSVVYEYGDSSVEPQYHRSYVIEATPDSVRVVVDSYGDVLADSTYALSEGRFEALLGKLDRAELRAVSYTGGQTGTGGTSESFTVMCGNEVLLSGVVYHCGGDDYGTLAGDLEAATRAVRVLVPNLDQLTD